MTRVSSAIPTLINGVSQQPDVMRLPSQLAKSTNFYPSVVEGNKKRPATRHVAKLATSATNPSVFTIKRDATEKYKLIVSPSGVEVFDFNGAKKTVSAPGGWAYLAASNPQTAYRTLTIADSTLILNKEVTVSMGASLTPTQSPRAIVFVKAANYATTYTLTINGGSVSFSTTTTDAGSTASIAFTLCQGWPSNYAFTVIQSTIFVWTTDSSPITISASDSRGNTCIAAFKNTVQRFSELPTVAPTGFTLEVIGDSGSNFDNYFVEFQCDNPSETFGKGVWVETVKPGIPYTFDASTMPHALTRNADGTFTFAPISWDNRVVGDTKSAPDPTFVGSKINGMFFFQNRLGLLSDENVVMSKAGDYFDFWPKTATALLDSDPIDTGAGSQEVSVLHNAVAFQSDIMIFAENAQFGLDYGEVLSPKTCQLKPLTHFASTVSTCAPVAAGKTVYFPNKRGAWGAIHEYYVDVKAGVHDAVEITSHVPKYLDGEVSRMSVSDTEGFLIGLTSNAPTKAFFYKFMWSGEDKVQSAFGTWEFSGQVVDADVYDSDVYLIMKYADGLYLERMTIQPAYTDPGASYETLLDRKVDQTVAVATYNDVSNKTTWTLPYQTQAVSVVTKDGLLLTASLDAPNKVSTSGNKTMVPVWLGVPYTAKFSFSKPSIKEATDSGGKAVVGIGRLQIAFWNVLFDATAYFRAEVTPKYRDTSKYTYTGRTLGAGSAKIGEVNLSSGKFRFPVLCLADEAQIDIINDSCFPSQFLSAEWEGEFIIKSKRL